MSLTIPILHLKLYNTASRCKEELQPLVAGHVNLYTCGPTVYHFAHIGNFRTYVFEDLLRRTIQFFGLTITQVMNLTDVDDKTIKGAIENKLSLEEYTKPYTEAFFEDRKTLHLETVEFYPAATAYIASMIKMIEVLMQKKIAYIGGDGSIYYAIKQFPRYGCLSHLKLAELEVDASERISNDEYDKENAADFVLWKKYDSTRDGAIFWDSPFGPGRPGWHLECSAMAMELLGETLDIHVGAVDNIFPHHENEIAQSEACSGQPFVKLWMHAEHLLVDNRKMSKSLGNFYTLRDLLKMGYTGAEVRYMLLQTHYKTSLNFTFAGLVAVKNTLSRLQDFIRRLQEITGSMPKDNLIEQSYFIGILQQSLEEFSRALADDLNISCALAVVFELVREVNTLCDAGQIDYLAAQKVLELLAIYNRVLAIFELEAKEDVVPAELNQALIQRLQARRDKNWLRADELRDFITSQGYKIEDTPQGARLKKI